MSNIFTENNNVYDLRNKREFKTENVLNGRETVSHKYGKLYLTRSKLQCMFKCNACLKPKLNIGILSNASAGYVVFLLGILGLLTF